MIRVNVAGLGPGNPEYIIPAAVKAIAESDIIIGGSRNISLLDRIGGLDLSGIERYDLTGRLDETRELILRSIGKRKVTVVASGDPGFYGILAFLRRFLDADQLNVIPGISSVQYMFARLGMPWESVRLGSLHGKEEDISALVAGGCAAFLTDSREDISAIAHRLCSSGFSERMMYAGCDLSYPEEIIYSGRVKDFVTMEIVNRLCVVAVADE